MRRWCCFLGCLFVCFVVIQVSAQTATSTPLPAEATVIPTFGPLLMITSTPLPPVVNNLIFTTYTAKDLSFAFEYPTGWIIAEESYYTSFTAPLEVGDITFTVFNPRMVTGLTKDQPDEVSALSSLRQYFDFISEAITTTTVGWRRAAFSPIAVNGQNGGLAMLMQVSHGGYGMVFVTTNPGQLSGFLPLIDIMLRRYDSPGSRRLATREQLTLSTHVGDRESIIAGLVSQKLIKPQVTLLDNVEAIDLHGDTAQLHAMAERLPANSVIMMGEMAFQPQSTVTYESCAFLLHVVGAKADDPDQSLRHYLEVGLDQAGTLYYFDAGRIDANVIKADLRTRIDLTRSHSFVLLLTNERMTVYLDGINVADNVLVRGVAGTAGLALNPTSDKTHCLFRNVALYLFTPIPAGLCTVAPRTETNSRIAPRSSSAVATHLTAETPQRVMAYLTGSGSQTRWWKLEDGSWLREDSVEETGDCDNIPIAN